MMRPISERRFQRLLLAMPIVVPILFLPINAYVTYHPGWQSVQMPLAILGFSLLFGGIPYVVLVLAVLRWARSRPTRALWRIAPLMPLLMIVVFAACYLALVYRWREGRFPSGALDGWWLYPLCILILGYLYVGFGMVVKALVESLGWIVAEQPGE